MAQDEKEDKGGKGAKPALTPEQEAEAAAKKAARADAKAKGGGAKGAGKGKGKGGAATTLEVASERVKRTDAGPAAQALRHRDSPEADLGVQAGEPDGGAAPHQDHHQHGSR